MIVADRAGSLTGIIVGTNIVFFANNRLGAGRNFEASLRVQSLRGTVELGTRIGAKRETFCGLAGLGDLVAAGFSNESHNRKFGRLLGSGRSPAQIEPELKLLPEGARNTKATCKWAVEKNLKLKLAEFVQALVEGKRLSLFSIG